MAGCIGDAFHRVPPLRAAGGTQSRTGLAASDSRSRLNNPGDDFPSSRKLAPQPDLGLRCELRCDSGRGNLPGSAYRAPPIAQGYAERTVKLGVHAVGM